MQALNNKAMSHINFWNDCLKHSNELHPGNILTRTSLKTAKEIIFSHGIKKWHKRWIIRKTVFLLQTGPGSAHMLTSYLCMFDLTICSQKSSNTFTIWSFLFSIGSHSMQGWTATMGHRVTGKRNTKRLKHTRNLF